MYVINARNVNNALARGLRYLSAKGVLESSRNGPVLVAPGPVCTVYSHPWEKVLFSPLRDANPFFHLFESLWMLAGRNDVAFPAQFNKRFLSYSDDGKTQRGAYGYRWRNWFGYDQLLTIIEELKRDPGTRRAVLTMWDAGEEAYAAVNDTGYEAPEGGWGDLLAASKDKPCNTHAYFDVRGGKLNMTVLCRSNDIYWGAYGANAVHFAFLLEYVAAKVGVPMGLYRQFSNNYHLYTDVVPLPTIQDQIENAVLFERYSPLTGNGCDSYTPLGEDPYAGMFEPNLILLMDCIGANARCPRLDVDMLNTGAAMWNVWRGRKLGLEPEPLESINAEDWRIACATWLARRVKKMVIT